MSTSSINTKAFRSLSCGVYIVSAKNGKTMAGCIINTLLQVTSSPARVIIAINKDNYTTGVILESGRFEASVLAKNASMELIGRFGFQTSADTDKFADTVHEFDGAGIPYVSEDATAHFGARVIDKVDVGSHFVIVGEVEFASVLSNEEPMTYAYYHLVKGGKTPPKASSFIHSDSDAEPSADAQSAQPQEDAPRFGWRCKICGHVVKTDELPDDFKCPMCGMGRDMFERIEL